MNRILCPVDFSDASLNALEFAAKIAKKHDSSIKLIHVVTGDEYNEELGEYGEDTLEVVRSKIKTRLQSLCDQINRNTSREYNICSFEIVSGDLTEAVVDISKQEGMSMIVMGTYGVKDISEAQMGSQTVKVINNADIPVLSVPADSVYHDFNRIVYGSEFEEADRLFLQQVINFAVPYNSRIYLVHVAESSWNEEELNDYVEEIKSYLNYKKLSVEEFVTSEEVSIALEHTLNVHEAHLLVLVHKSRNFLENLFHRSLTKKMSYLTNFPLLALRN